jgi:hypothetical protein
MSGLLPNYILREWDNTGHLLNGGKIFFYQSGTLTPKAVYTDATLSTAHTNPVILDAGGAADIWLGDGAYRVLIQDSLGNQIRPPIDGVVGSGGAGGVVPTSNATAGFFALYNDVRILTGAPPDFVYVTGAYLEGDGGAGWFQKQSGSLTDDDGIILTANSGALVYKRVFSGSINPQWYSVQYGVSTDNSVALGKALVASATWNIPVRCTDSVYLTQNITVPSGAGLEMMLGSAFVSGSVISVTFSTGSRFSSIGVAFGSTVNPVFGESVADELQLSWFGGATDNERFTKLAASTSSSYRLLIDIDTSHTQAVTIPANFATDFNGGAQITFTAAAALSIGRLAYGGMSKIINYTDASYITTVTIGADAIRPEWFGALGDGTTNDYLGFYAAAKTGRVDLTNSKAYLLGAGWTTPTPLSITGGIVLLSGTTLGTGSLSLDSTIIVKTIGSWFAGTALYAVNSEMPPTYTAVTQSITGCKTTGSALFPTFKGSPYVENTHLDLISAQLLGTDSAGKVIPGATNLPKSKQLVGTDASGNIVDAGSSINLSIAGMAGLYFSDWEHAAITGTVTLTNPLRLVYMIDNTGSVNITLPTMSVTTNPNLILMLVTGTGTVTVYGTFNRPSGSGYIAGNKPFWLYYDYQTSTWNYGFMA